jgi:hypothetical protein
LKGRKEGSREEAMGSQMRRNENEALKKWTDWITEEGVKAICL